MDTLDEIESLPWFRKEVRQLREQVKELEKLLTIQWAVYGAEITPGENCAKCSGKEVQP